MLFDRVKPLDAILATAEKKSLHRSLGAFMILDHAERGRSFSLPHVYLGYWVEGSRKMEYKSRFLPQERLGMSGWVRVG